MARKRAKKLSTVWKFKDFASSWILREIISGASKRAKIVIWAILEAWNLDFWGFLHLSGVEINKNHILETMNLDSCRFQQLFKTEIDQNWNFRANKMAKIAVFTILNLPNLISRKIWVAEYLLNFHTVIQRPRA